MKSTLKTKLDQLLERYEELGALMSDGDVISDQNMFRAYSREYAEIEPVVLCYRDYERQLNELEETKILASDEDEDIRAMAAEELDDLQSRVDGLDQSLQKLLLPRDPNDSHNVFLEIRAGTGGDEAAIFAGDLFKMYQRFAETRNWKVEIMNERAGDHGGFKEIISRIAGKEVFGQLKFESGAHRVQRVPQTESQGRIHTSACTVAVMPEVEDVDEIEIDKNDLRVDTYRASGSGGQHVIKRIQPCD